MRDCFRIPSWPGPRSPLRFPSDEFVCQGPNRRPSTPVQESPRVADGRLWRRFRHECADPCRFLQQVPVSSWPPWRPTSTIMPTDRWLRQRSDPAASAPHVRACPRPGDGRVAGRRPSMGGVCQPARGRGLRGAEHPRSIWMGSGRVRSAMQLAGPRWKHAPAAGRSSGAWNSARSRVDLDPCGHSAAARSTTAQC